MVSWIIIAALIALILVFIRIKHFQNRTYIIILIVIALFVYLTVSKVVSENNINIKTFNGMVTAGKLYFSWLGNTFDNTKTIVGNAVKMDWRGNLTKTGA